MSIKERIQNSIAEAVAGARLEAMRKDIAKLEESIEFNDPGASNWQEQGQSLTGETDVIDISVARANSRYYARRDPLYGRAKRLTRNYTFGRGVAWRAADPTPTIRARFGTTTAPGTNGSGTLETAHKKLALKQNPTTLIGTPPTRTPTMTGPARCFLLGMIGAVLSILP